MTTATFTPYDLAEAVQIGKRTFRKQILPLTTINYKGQQIAFDKPFLADLASSFNAGAYDQVPLVFAGDKNEHNENPRNFSGELKGVELTDDGLDGIIELTDEGVKAVSSNPRLGVSARIIEGLSKSDGRTFPRAIRHVLMTMDPKATGMRPWEAVDLSDADKDQQVVDLTAETYKEDAHMGDTKVDKTKQTITTPDGKVLDLASLTDEAFEALLDLTAVVEEEPVVDDKTDPPADDKPDDQRQDGEVWEKDGKTYAKVEGKIFLMTEAVAPVVEDDKGGGGGGGGGTDLSDEVVDQTVRDEVTQMRIDLAENRFRGERTDLLRAGVPRAMIDLAEPLLKAPTPVVIDLSSSDGDKDVNATKIVRDLLASVKGYVDLNPEIGHQVDLSEEEDTKEDPTEAFLTAWDEQFGPV